MTRRFDSCCVICRWGYWGYGDTYGRPENEAAYKATLDTSMNFWDTGWHSL